MRRGIRQAVSAVVAMSLACSMVPASALASEQHTDTVPLARAAAAGTQLSIDVPSSLDLGGGEALSIEEVDSWGPLSASVTFNNTSGVDLYLSGVELRQGTAAAPSGSYLGGDFDSLFASGTLGVSFKAKDGTAAENDSCALYKGILENQKQALTMPDDPQTAFLCLAGEKVIFTLEVDHSKAVLRDDLRFWIDYYNGQFKLGALGYTFQVALPEGTGDPDKSAADNGGMFLKVLDPPQTEALKPWAGQTYSLADVKAHSRGLPAAGESSDLYTLYNLLATSMTPEGDYDCRVSYKKDASTGYEDWPVRIIGVNQDVAASTVDGFTKGKPVGLTFQFRDLVECSWSIPEGTRYTIGGWGGENIGYLRSKLQIGGVYYDKLHDGIRNGIVTVRKAYCPDWNRETAGVGEATDDRMFLISWYELVGLDPHTVWPNHIRPWMVNEGTGADHNEQYLFYQNKGIEHLSQEGGANYKWVNKWCNRDDARARVETAEGGNQSVIGNMWVFRTIEPMNDESSLGNYAGSTHEPVGGGHPSWLDEDLDGLGVCPCFCL